MRFMVVVLSFCCAQMKQHNLHSSLHLKRQAILDDKLAQHQQQPVTVEDTTSTPPLVDSTTHGVANTPPPVDSTTHGVKAATVVDRKQALDRGIDDLVNKKAALLNNVKKLEETMKAARRDLTSVLLEKSRVEKKLKDDSEAREAMNPPSAEGIQGNSSTAASAEKCNVDELCPPQFPSYEALTLACVVLLLCALASMSKVWEEVAKVSKAVHKTQLVSSKLSEATAELTTCRGQLASMRAQLDEATTGNVDLQARLHELVNANGRDDVVMLMEDTIKSLRRQLRAVKEEASMSEERIDELQAQIKQLKAESDAVVKGKGNHHKSVPGAAGTATSTEKSSSSSSSDERLLAELYTLSSELAMSRADAGR